MRKLIAVLILAALLCGCAAQGNTMPTPAVTEASTHPATQPSAETVMPTELSAATEAAPTEAAPESTPPEPPYLQKVTYADQSIFDGPGYDYAFVGTVKEAGTYTIVEEAWDTEDNLWGRLKSGAGWIDLTEVRLRIESPDPLSANYADDLLLKSEDFHRYTGSSSEYAVSIAFRANEVLTDVALCSMELTETMEVAEQLFFLSRLEPGKPLVADLEFPGDMTTYAVFFTDSSGSFRKCAVSISGRNGTLELWEYAP